MHHHLVPQRAKSGSIWPSTWYKNRILAVFVRKNLAVDALLGAESVARTHTHRQKQTNNLYEGRRDRISLRFWESVTLSTDSWESSLSAMVEIWNKQTELWAGHTCTEVISCQKLYKHTNRTNSSTASTVGFFGFFFNWDCVFVWVPTCTAWTCGDWITDGCAAWMTPWTWTVCPLGSCTSVTVGPVAEAWPVVIDT